MERNYYQNKQRTKTPTARKQVGLLTSAGWGMHVTAVYSMSPYGHYMAGEYTWLRSAAWIHTERTAVCCMNPYGSYMVGEYTWLRSAAWIQTLYTASFHFPMQKLEKWAHWQCHSRSIGNCNYRFLQQQCCKNLKSYQQICESLYATNITIMKNNKLTEMCSRNLTFFCTER
jgi:hypothetical protein